MILVQTAIDAISLGAVYALAALGVADRGYVLETGTLVAEGRPDALWENAEIQAAYLGGRRAGA